MKKRAEPASPPVRVVLQLTATECDALVRYRAFAKARGYHSSAPLLVLITLLRQDGPATIADIRRRAQKKFPIIGYATVLRALNKLVEAGFAQRSGRLPYLFTRAPRRAWP